MEKNGFFWPVIPSRRARRAMFNELRLVAGLNRQQCADVLGVTPETVTRWVRERQTPNGCAVRLLRIYAGYMPWRGWAGFRCAREGIYAPGAAVPVTPDDVIKIDILKQRLALLEQEARAPAQYLLDFRD